MGPLPVSIEAKHTPRKDTLHAEGNGELSAKQCVIMYTFLVSTLLANGCGLYLCRSNHCKNEDS
jgi:hypothetical protein